MLLLPVARSRCTCCIAAWPRSGVLGVVATGVATGVVPAVLSPADVPEGVTSSPKLLDSSGMVNVFIAPTEVSTERTVARFESGRDCMVRRVRLTACAAAGANRGSNCEAERAPDAQEVTEVRAVLVSSLAGGLSRNWEFCSVQFNVLAPSSWNTEILNISVIYAVNLVNKGVQDDVMCPVSYGLTCRQWGKCRSLAPKYCMLPLRSLDVVNAESSRQHL